MKTLDLNKRLVLITDENLHALYRTYWENFFEERRLTCEILTFPAGENYKTRETKQQLEDQLLEKNFGRDTVILAFGGGVVTDLAGFLAATYCRGVDVIYIPTTLLAMVDAAAGGKTAVNTPYGKNLIGVFSEPHAVWMDSDFLKTLPEKEWKNGMAEVIKHALIASSDIFHQLENRCLSDIQNNPVFLDNMITESRNIKQNIVEQDARETQGIRELLNFGHSIGHAVEVLEHYQMGHGEAVAIGMIVEGYLSVLSSLLQQEALERIIQVLQNYGLPLSTAAFQDKETFKKVLQRDKKSVHNTPYFILLKAIGEPASRNNRYAMSVEEHYLDEALDWAGHFFKK